MLAHLTNNILLSVLRRWPLAVVLTPCRAGDRGHSCTRDRRNTAWNVPGIESQLKFLEGRRFLCIFDRYHASNRREKLGVTSMGVAVPFLSPQASRGTSAEALPRDGKARLLLSRKRTGMCTILSLDRPIITGRGERHRTL